MKYCPNCGVAVEDGQRFCGECGAKLDFDPLPAEPVYTEDERLKNDPVLNAAAQAPRPREKRGREKVPELTLEPDLWGAAAQAAQSAPAAEPAAQAALPETEKPDYEWADAEYHGPAQSAQGDYHAPKQEASELPNDYTMSRPPAEEKKMPDETLMLIWSIALSGLFSICGIVGLVKTLKARKQTDPALKYKLLSSAKIWLIVGTALRLFSFLAELF